MADTTASGAGAISIDTGAAAADRLIVMTTSTIGASFNEMTGFSLGGVNAKGFLEQYNGTGGGYVVYLAWWTETELGSLSGSQSFASSGGTWDSAWSTHPAVWTGIDADGPTSSGINTEGGGTDINMGPVTAASGDYFIFGAMNGGTSTGTLSVTPSVGIGTVATGYEGTGTAQNHHFGAGEPLTGALSAETVTFD